jgi:hypothetical protein
MTYCSCVRCPAPFWLGTPMSLEAFFDLLIQPGD